MSRIDRALQANVGPAPPRFIHSIAPGKPAPPSTSTLTADELVQFSDWLNKRMYGTISPTLVASLLPNVQAMIITYETTYFTAPAFIEWANRDLDSREWQYRFRQIDIAEAVAALGTVPVSADTAGTGTSAPSAAQSASSRKLIFGKVVALDISSSTHAILSNDSNVTMFDNTSGSGLYAYITDIVISIFGSTAPSTGVHRIDLRRAASANPMWEIYMLPPTTAAPVSIFLISLRKPLIFVPGDVVNVGATLVTAAGTAAGYKLDCSVTGYVE